MSLSKETIEIAALLGEKLEQKGWHMSCAESCTGGGIGYAITSTSGSSNWFEQGFITYSNKAKHKLLGVSEQDLEAHGAVSEPVVLQMASGAAKNADAQLAISVSGVAGPNGGSPDKPVGTVWFGRFSIDEQGNAQSTACRKVFEGDRHQVREQTIIYALQYCLEVL